MDASVRKKMNDDFEWRKTINIGNCTIGYGNPAFIVAEAGVAHFGSIE